MPVILLVEDHADTRAMYAEFLRPSFEVAEAADAERALEMMSESVPDLVITDLSLPGLNGFELIGRMRSNPALKIVPVICLSGFGGHAHEARAREAGCNRILQKPCLPDELAREATELLRKKNEEGSQA